MRKYFNKRGIAVLTLGLVCIMGMPMTSFASSETIYSYSNLCLTWTTSDTGTSTVLKSDRKASMIVEFCGVAYSGNKYQNFGSSSGLVYDNKAIASAKRSYINIRDGYVRGCRNQTQSIERVLYYR